MWIIKINAITNLIAFIIGSIQFRFFSKELKTVYYFVTFGLLTEIYSKIHLHYIMKNTTPIGHFYFPIAFLIAGLFYKQILSDFIKPKYILTIIIAFLIYCLINSLFIQNLFEYASLEGSIGSIIIFLFSILFFTKVMIEAKIVKLSKEPLIWINSSFLLYYTGNFFFYALYNLRANTSYQMALFAGQVFSVLNLIFYLLIAIGFLKVDKALKTNQQDRL